MSRHHIEKVTCPSCHHEGDFELWDSINTALEPEMKEKVLNQSIFLYTCPSCGETFRLNYSTLYHQMEDLVMIYLVPESEVKKTYEIFYEKNVLADYRTEKYLYRIIQLSKVFFNVSPSKFSAQADNDRTRTNDKSRTPIFSFDILLKHYFNALYSPSATGSHHSVDVSSPGTSTAKCANQLSGAAPCQCFTPAGMTTTSPGCSCCASLPHS